MSYAGFKFGQDMKKDKFGNKIFCTKSGKYPTWGIHCYERTHSADETIEKVLRVASFSLFSNNREQVA